MVFVIDFSVVFQLKFGNWNVLASETDFIYEHFSSHNNRIARNLFAGNVDVSGDEIEVVNFNETFVSDDFDFKCFLCCFFYFFIGSE